MASILHISKEDGKGKECDKMVEKDARNSRLAS